MAENGSSVVTFTRDFPLGFVNSTPFSCSPPLKYLQSCTRDFPPGCGPNATRENFGSGQFKTKGKPPLAHTTGVHSGSGPGFGRTAVKKPKTVLLNQVMSSGQTSDRRSKEREPVRSVGPSTVNVGGQTGQGRSKERERVKELLRRFTERCTELSKSGVKRADIEAHKELKRKGNTNTHHSFEFGSVPGVEIGDQFHYRVELVLVGLHRLFQGGIDAVEDHRQGGQRCATCIVANEGHSDKMTDPNVLTYIGEGGTLKRHEFGVPPDQVLTGGNLALDNSRASKKPVRVVRGLRYGSGNAKIVYIYDGLYTVTETVKKRGPQGNVVIEFVMTRDPGQAPVPWREYKRKLA